MPLTEDEIERYARHIVLREIGGAGQAKLKRTRVIVVGAGGLGSPVLMSLATAGVGELGIVDHDHVSLSNLQRQAIYRTIDVGRLKVDASADAIRLLNPHVYVRTFPESASADNIRDLVRNYDLVLDCSDNFATRYAVSDAGYLEKKTVIMGAVQTFDGLVTTLKPFENDATGGRYPTYRCLFPEPPPTGTVPACSEAGVVGAITALVGSMMAMEALRVVLGIGRPLLGKVLLINGRDLRFETLDYFWDPSNLLNGTGERDTRKAEK